MTLLTPELRQSLRRTRVVPGLAIARGGVGERRSRTKGEGIEFEDFRPYAFGDDMRRLDPHVHARLGQNVIRQYNVPERLSVSILLDTSESMLFGEPDKARIGMSMAAGLALCALTGSDTVRCGALVADRVDWHPVLRGVGRLDELEAWLLKRRFGGRVDLLGAITSSITSLPRHGLLILVSDMWFDDVAPALSMLASADQSVAVVRVLAAEEIDPARYASGPVRLIDSETGEDIELDVGGPALDLYKTLASEAAAKLRRDVLKVGGRFATVTNDGDLADVFQRALRQADIIR